MLSHIINFSIKNKLIVLLFTTFIIGFGLYSLTQLSIGAVPDITNNQVQIITTSKTLATEDVEKFLTYPVELEMANLPGVKEIRSISKFGLSVVTVVFDDDLGTYLPRQLIAEKIKSAEEKIPLGFGKPFMGPISSGLGEIYQYVIDVEPKYKDQYSLSDIRTLQDWVIKRQLSGIAGVVEVNTWGGNLKTYEVAVNPERLRAMDVSVFDVFSALEKNNSIAGGGYIEKSNESYFIRGEGLISGIKDIEDIVVTTKGDLPVYVRDIAKVGFGMANRFGAITGNGEGEKVLGQVMMLKDANSNAVIEAVKKRVSEIQTTLPEGIKINPILERSELIAKTSFTIAENLILGCLIVIFVVVLLLGNWRSGLVVASVIPLCLLFALSLMYIFGVDANLMSLGAIDFGIIIDGAVIIVEFIAFKITSQRAKLLTLPKEERQDLIDTITYQGASKMMNSAVFGQLIIIIVFIPILSLANVEGKMFRPMALVFCFALMGAMVFCFTYIPVMASLFIKPTNTDKKTISSRLINFFERNYRPIILWALRKKKLVLSIAVGFLVITGFLFTRMGGEFIPTLDEGDFVIQPILKTGMSLGKTIETTTQIEKILKKSPEVEQVASRIGAAEVPTDPMSMEESDVIIKLKPKSEWVSAQSKDELADKLKEALTNEIAGVGFEFTQPIEMRFNELISGVRADLAIKIFGEDLEVLNKKALEIEKAIQDIEGAADISVEKTAGLPQMSVKYNRQKIAKYGLNIEDLNKVITIGFAGMSAGTVFEGEKQFDLILRFDDKYRKDIENLETATFRLASGATIPLSELANIIYTKGPAKISRDNTKRRVVVGVNVRNRDLESVVKDVQTAIEKDVKIPTGYSVSYGGQFENLRTATARLKIAVPIALVLIFVLLYFAFDSVKDALMIYSAIPLSAIGGVLLLYIRDLPFSISAGVGFIALFGIAVLNGIVLIEEFKELKSEGIKNINKQILMGTKNRLRPIILTAAAAALGFLPMAISTSAGAEVQRPLATVVIGGLITATALTLVVLPILYAIFNSKINNVKSSSKLGSTLGLFFLLFVPFSAMAQQTTTKVEQVLELAFLHNNSLQAQSNRIKQSEQLVGGAYNLDKTQLYYNYDENNIAENSLPIQVFGISQTLQFPTIYGAQHKVEKQKIKLTNQQYHLNKIQLTKEVYTAYYNVVYHNSLVKQYMYIDSIYSRFAIVSRKRYDVGETNLLEKLTTEAKKEEANLALFQAKADAKKAETILNSWVQNDSIISVAEEVLPKLNLIDFSIANHPGISYYHSAETLAKSSLSLERQKLLPDLQLSFFQGTNNGLAAKNYQGVQFGMALPIWFGANKARINAAKTETLIIANEMENYTIQLQSKYDSLLSDLKKFQEMVDYYENTGRILSKQITTTATKSFLKGEIDFLQCVQLLDNAKNIEINYLQNLNKYNQTVLELNYITN